MKYRLVSYTVLSLFIIVGYASCGGGGGPSDVLQVVPEGDYFGFMGFDAEELFNAYAFKQMMKVVEGAESYFENMEDQWEGSSIKVTELDSVLLIASSKPNEMIVYFRGGNIDIDDFNDFLEEKWRAEIDEKEENGVTFWNDEKTDFGFTQVHGGLFMAQKDVLEDCIGAMTAGGDRMTDDKDFQKALGLVDLDSTFYGLIWDRIDVRPLGLERFVSRIDDAVVEDVMDALEEIESAGFTIRFGHGMEIGGKVLFDDEESAATVEKFLQSALEEYSDRFTENVRLLARKMVPGLDTRTLEEFLDRITIFRNGAVVGMQLRIDDIDTLVEAAKAGVKQVEMQKATARTLRNLGWAVEQYIMDHPEAGAPKAEDIRSLIKILEENELLFGSIEGVDGWGNPFFYRFDPEPGGRHYSIISYGGDGKAGPEITREEDGVKYVVKFAQDIIWSDGRLVQLPEEW